MPAPGQVQRGSGEGSKSGSTGFGKVPEKVPEKVPGSLRAKPSQVQQVPDGEGCREGPGEAFGNL